MNKSLFLLLCACSSVYAESRVLPPIVDNSIYAAGISSTAVPASANVIYDVLGRVEQLQNEIQQLRGLVEEQSQTIVALKKRQANIYSDLDLRLQELTQAGGRFKSNTVAESLPDPKKITVSEPVKPVVAVVQPPVRNPKLIYQQAYEMLRNGHNTQAITAFKAFLVEFPKNEYADNSQYWLGEAYKVNRDFKSAKIAFSKVLSLYANSPKVADALLKLGYIELEQNNDVKARDYLTRITVNYPGTTAAHLATKKLIQIGVMKP